MELERYGRFQFNEKTKQVVATIPAEISKALNLRKSNINFKIFVEVWTDDKTEKESKCLVVLPLEGEE